jgi:hypothetical protein
VLNDEQCTFVGGRFILIIILFKQEGGNFIHAVLLSMLVKCVNLASINGRLYLLGKIPDMYDSEVFLNEVQWNLELRTQSVPGNGSTFKLLDFQVKFFHKK